MVIFCIYTAIRPRVEKHGGRVSQPYSWRIARFLKDLMTSPSWEDSDFSSVDIIQHLRSIEAGNDLPHERRSLPEIEWIRTLARSLWSRRIGVLIHRLDSTIAV